MKVEIIEEKKNPLLEREELRIRVVHDRATPPLSEVRDKIIAMKNASKDTVIVDSFKSRFGIRESIGFVKIYKTKERALQVEPRHRLEKNLLVERTKKVEKPKKQEKPAVPKKEAQPKKEAKQSKVL